jgi:hypothetical protein
VADRREQAARATRGSNTLGCDFTQRQHAVGGNTPVRHDAEQLAGWQAGILDKHLEIVPPGNRSPDSHELTVEMETPNSRAILLSGILFFRRQALKAVAKLARTSQ